MPNTFIYARFSPRPNAEDSKSIEVQIDACERYCRMHDFEITDTFIDRETSARTVPFLDRFGGSSLWKRILRGDRIICARLDRAFRNSLDGHRMFEMFAENDIEIHFVAQDGCSLNNKTATGKLLLSMSLAVAEYEPMIISERTKAALRHKRATLVNTFATSKIPFGYSPDYSEGTKDGSASAKKLMFCEPELATIKKILSARIGTNGMSFNAIANRLTELKVECRDGQWNATRVARICKAWELNEEGKVMPHGQES